MRLAVAAFARKVQKGLEPKNPKTPMRRTVLGAWGSKLGACVLFLGVRSSELGARVFFVDASSSKLDAWVIFLGVWVSELGV